MAQPALGTGKTQYYWWAFTNNDEKAKSETCKHLLGQLRNNITSNCERALEDYHGNILPAFQSDTGLKVDDAAIKKQYLEFHKALTEFEQKYLDVKSKAEQVKEDFRVLWASALIDKQKQNNIRHLVDLLDLLDQLDNMLQRAQQYIYVGVLDFQDYNNRALQTMAYAHWLVQPFVCVEWIQTAVEIIDFVRSEIRRAQNSSVKDHQPLTQQDKKSDEPASAGFFLSLVQENCMLL